MISLHRVMHRNFIFRFIFMAKYRLLRVMALQLVYVTKIRAPIQPLKSMRSQRGEICLQEIA